MASLKVVVVDVASNGGSGFLDVMPLRQVGFLILEGPKPTLDLDIVSPTALAIHVLAYMVLLEELFVFLACELTVCAWLRERSSRDEKIEHPGWHFGL